MLVNPMLVKTYAPMAAQTPGPTQERNRGR